MKVVAQIVDSGLGLTLTPQNQQTRLRIKRYTRQFVPGGRDHAYFQEHEMNEVFSKYSNLRRKRNALESGFTETIIIDSSEMCSMIGYDTHVLVDSGEIR